MENRNKLPAVSKVLEVKLIKLLISKYSRELVVNTIRDTINSARDNKKFPTLEEVSSIVENRIKKIISPGIKKIINCTGTLVHTNFGRALMHETIFEKMKEILTGYTNLEFNIKTGKRGGRAPSVEEKIIAITGAESALIVNNNAAAILLAINTFSNRKEVLVSRGELIEIGGAFRLPDIIKRSGGKLKELGTTNKTYAKDYLKEVSTKTGMILKMHTSNYKIVGFTEEASAKELAAIAKEKNIPFMYDIGSGAFIDTEQYGLVDEPPVQKSINEGYDIITMSGDKLVGGPQAGIIVGKKEYIDKMRKNPLMRTIRMGKLSLLALEFSLIEFLKNNGKDLPLYKQLSTEINSVEELGKKIINKIEYSNNYSLELIKSEGSAGGGSQPGEVRESRAILITSTKINAKKLDIYFRNYSTAIVGRFISGKFALDLLSLLDKEESIIVLALNELGNILND